MPYAIYTLPKSRYGVTAIFRHHVSCRLKSLDLASRTIFTIRVLLSPVVVPDNKASDDIDLEYQLQRIMRSSR
jgi:hypothetical protein